MKYTVQKLADLACVSVRTLHYYDEIDLLKPSYVHENGYRYYEQKELLRLQQILFFRELEFSLEQITKMMKSPTFNMAKALEDQKKMLEIKKKRINALIMTINTTIDSMKGGENKMSTNKLYDGFDKKEMEQYQEEAKQRWGDTDAYKQSQERTKNWTDADYKRIAQEGNIFTQKLANAMDKDIKSPKVQELVRQHHKGIETFYDCSYEMYRGLAEMYVADARFTKFYDKFRPGLAKWLRDAIMYYCDQQEK